MKFDLANFLNLNPVTGQSDLLRLLQEIQRTEGYISSEAVAVLSSHLQIPENKIVGVMSFYNQFRVKPAGKYIITACCGTNCHLNGSQQVVEELEKLLKLKPGQTGRDKRFTLTTSTCLGGCGKNPVIRINEQYHQINKLDQLRRIIESLP